MSKKAIFLLKGFLIGSYILFQTVNSQRNAENVRHSYPNITRIFDEGKKKH